MAGQSGVVVVEPWPTCLKPEDASAFLATGIVDTYKNATFSLAERTALTESVMIVAPAADGVHFVCALSDASGHYELNGAQTGQRWVMILPTAMPTEVEPTLIFIEVTANITPFPVLPRAPVAQVFLDLGVARDPTRGQALALLGGVWQTLVQQTDNTGRAFALNVPAQPGYGSLVSAILVPPPNITSVIQPGPLRIAAGVTAIHWIGTTF